MLKVNVGFSRKVSRDFNSTGFSVNLEGEILAPLDDPEMVVGKIQELYDLAEESLNQQVERYESESAIGSRDEAPPARNAPPPSRSMNGNGRSNEYRRPPATSPNRNGNSRTADTASFTPASNKQISFMTNLARQQGITTPQLRQRVAEIVGKEVDLYDLSKSEAGVVLDELTAGSNSPASRRR